MQSPEILSILSELLNNYQIDASVRLEINSGESAARILPVLGTAPQAVFSLLEGLCREMSFTLPMIRYAIVDFQNHSKPTIVDCSRYQK